MSIKRYAFPKSDDFEGPEGSRRMNEFIKSGRAQELQEIAESEVMKRIEGVTLGEGKHE